MTKKQVLKLIKHTQEWERSFSVPDGVTGLIPVKQMRSMHHSSPCKGMVR